MPGRAIRAAGPAAEAAAIRLFFKRQARPVSAEAVPESFEAALEAEAPAAVPDEGDPAPLASAMAFVREHLATAENLGETRDGRDFYEHLDRLSDGVAQAFPQSFCRAGCSGCCHYPIGLFTVSFTEWSVIRKHLETEWTEAQRDALVARYRRDFNWFWTFVIGYLQNSYLTLMLTAPWVYRRKLACPFLENDRCSIYAVRPYQCRTFGYFSARSWPFKEPRIYACNAQGDNLLTLLKRKGPQFQLPVMNPIIRRLRKRCLGPKLSLPMWLGAWVRTKA